MEEFDTIRSYHVENSWSSRLGGQIVSILADDGRRFFVKKGAGFERHELRRESRMLGCLQGLDFVPAMQEFHDDGDHAVLVTEAVLGLPLHEAAIGNVALVEPVLVDVFERLDAVAPEIYSTLPVAVLEEITDIEELISAPSFDAARFVAGVGQDPRVCLERIKHEVGLHDHCRISHGDLCLPNIVLTDAGRWSLLDWGKSGRGNRARDLAALRFSLQRNEMNEIWTGLVQRVGDEVTEAELTMYRQLDYFWYAMR